MNHFPWLSSSIHNSYSCHAYKSRTNEGTFTHLHHHQNYDADTHLDTTLMIFLGLEQAPIIAETYHHHHKKI